MQMNNFPGCCGARVFTGFPSRDFFDTHADSELKRQRVIDWMKGLRKQMATVRASHAYVTLNQFQAEYLHDLFVEDEWQVTSKDVKNPNTGNLLTTYFKIFLPKPRTKKKVQENVD